MGEVYLLSEDQFSVKVQLWVPVKFSREVQFSGEDHFSAKCIVVPENIHTPPTEGIGNSGEEGGLKDPKI